MGKDENEQDKVFSITFKENTIIIDDLPSYDGKCSSEEVKRNLENMGLKDCKCNKNEWRCSRLNQKIELIRLNQL